jgi:hypothetical protein
MGERGPVGKRSSASRNHSAGEDVSGGTVELATPLGPEPPEWLDGYALEWYEALLARCCMQLIRKPSAVMLASFLHGCTSLGVTEGDRRRIHIELETAKGGDPDRNHAVAQMDKYRNGLSLLDGDASGG